MKIQFSSVFRTTLAAVVVGLILPSAASAAPFSFTKIALVQREPRLIHFGYGNKITLSALRRQFFKLFVGIGPSFKQTGITVQISEGSHGQCSVVGVTSPPIGLC